jgi:DNA invertase Pin-like site-specific DNA recombinase
MIDQAILYAAKSSPDEKGSIADQLKEARKWAEEQSLEVADEYSEENVSAYKGDRGSELAAALEHTERIGATLIVQHSDRLARGDAKQARHLVEIALWAIKTDVKIHCVQDPSTFQNLLMAVVMGDRNMEDSRRKSTAIKAGHARRRKRGLHRGGVTPFGYLLRRNEADERVLVIAEERAPVGATYLRPLPGRLDLCGDRQGAGSRGRSLSQGGKPVESPHSAPDRDEPHLRRPNSRWRGANRGSPRGDHRPRDVDKDGGTARGKGTNPQAGKAKRWKASVPQGLFEMRNMRRGHEPAHLSRAASSNRPDLSLPGAQAAFAHL